MNAVGNGEEVALTGIHIVTLVRIKRQDDRRTFVMGALHARSDGGDDGLGLFAAQCAGDEIALHIHDNFITSDDHLIPFTGKVDFDYVAKELAQSGFDGTLMLEILYGRNAAYSAEPTYKDFAVKAKLAAEKLIGLVNRYRSS